MKDILIYTTAACPYCIVAKRALDGARIPYREIDITRTPHVRDELHAKTGERTVPQVFVDGVYIGQDDELVAMVESGELSADADGDGPAEADDEDDASGAAGGGTDDVYDVAIIGGGRGGLTLARHLPDTLNVVVLDRMPHTDGLRPARDILRQAVRARGVAFVEREVFGVEPGDVHTLITLDGTLAAHAVVIATGARGRTPDIAGESALSGKGVSYCAECDAAFFSGMTVAVAGVDERAGKAALLLAEHSRHVYLLCPEPALFAGPEMLRRLAGRGNVTVRTGARVTAIHGESEVASIAVADGRGGEELAVQGVFLYLYGRRPDTAFVKGLVARRADGAVSVSGPGRTSREGIYAVGPVAAEVGGAPPYGALAETIAKRLAARPVQGPL